MLMREHNSCMNYVLSVNDKHDYLEGTDSGSHGHVMYK